MKRVRQGEQGWEYRCDGCQTWSGEAFLGDDGVMSCLPCLNAGPEPLEAAMLMEKARLAQSLARALRRQSERLRKNARTLRELLV